jgi:NAD(P)H-dependent FMN reductase
MVKIQVIVGTTRPNRNSKAVGEWVYGIASQRQDIEVELVEVGDYNLPLFDEPVSPSQAQEYTQEHSRRWSQKIIEADGYIFVTAEYNHGIPGVLKNAIDFLYREWNNKAAGFVSYGSAGGSRSVEHLRGVMGEVQIADVREQVLLSLATDFENYRVFKPAERHEPQLNKMLDQLVLWAGAMQTVRQGQ